MPALRLFTVSILSACLAQAWAGPAQGAAAVRRDDHQGGGGGQGGYGGGYGGGQEKNYDQKPDDEYKEWEEYGDVPSPEQKDITVTLTEWATVTAPAPEQKNVEVTSTITVTEVAACDKNNVVTATATAYVTSCPSVPSPAETGCHPCSLMAWPEVPAGAGGLGNCPVVTTSDIWLGLTSIPANEAVVTGVTVAGAAGSPAAAVATSETSAAADCSCGYSKGKALWGAPGAYSASGAGQWPPMETNANSYWTSGSVALGLSSIPNTLAVAPGVGDWQVTASAPVSSPTVTAGIFAGDATPEVPAGTTTTTAESKSTSTRTSTKEEATTTSTTTAAVAPPSSSSSTLSSTSTSVFTATPAQALSTTPAAAVSAADTATTALSYGSYGLLGLGKRSAVATA